MSDIMTNQASEDDKAIMIGFLYGIQSDFLPADEVRHRMAGFRHTQGYKDAMKLIRTEKLKLLAEVRERQIPVIALKAKKPHDEVQIQAVPIKSLTKLEAEL